MIRKIHLRLYLKGERIFLLMRNKKGKHSIIQNSVDKVRIKKKKILDVNLDVMQLY